MPFFPHRTTDSVGGSSVGITSGDSIAFGGNATSCSAFVGHEPIQDRHPTHWLARTMTGRFLCFLSLGDVSMGNKASNGQCGIHRSQPVQSASTIATIDWPMTLLQHSGF